jgi:hypothetical protein
VARGQQAYIVTRLVSIAKICAIAELRPWKRAELGGAVAASIETVKATIPLIERQARTDRNHEKHEKHERAGGAGPRRLALAFRVVRLFVVSAKPVFGV